MPAFQTRNRLSSNSTDQLARGSRLHNWGPVLDSSVPVPPIASIPAGFDAIFQFTAPLLSDRLARVVGRTAHGIVSYGTSGLSDSVKQEIIARLQAAMQPSGSQPSPGGITISTGTAGGIPSMMTELPDPIALSVTAHSPSIRLNVGVAPFEAEVRWRIGVEIGVPDPTMNGPTTGMAEGQVLPELAIGGGNRVNPGTIPTTPESPMTPGGTGLRFIPLTQGTATTQANIRVHTSHAQYQAWARLDFAGSGIDLHPAADTLFDDLRDGEQQSQLTAGVQQSLRILFANPNLRITPRMALGGVLNAGEVLDSVQTVRVAHTTGLGNRPHHRVLSLCVNTGPAGVSGDLGLVSAFVDDRNFAYYLAEPIVASAVKVRLNRLPRPLEFTTMTPIDMELKNDPGVTVQGSGRLRFRILNVEDVLFDVTTVGLPDHMRFFGHAETTLLEAWNHRSLKIQDLGDYGQPIVDTYAVRSYPFGGGPEMLPGPTRQFFDGIVEQIVEPIDRPFAEAVGLSDIEGLLSGPLHAVFVRGRMTLR